MVRNQSLNPFSVFQDNLDIVHVVLDKRCRIWCKLNTVSFPAKFVEVFRQASRRLKAKAKD